MESLTGIHNHSWFGENLTMQPNVTIVLPVYNVEQYLRECLDSVVNQTMREIQIVCVNDGSTDGSLAILEEYAVKDSRITVINQENQGAGSARNAAFPHIKGKYTYFVDPDDWIDLHLCEKLFKYAEEHQAEIVYLGMVYVHNLRSGAYHKRDLLHKRAEAATLMPLEERKKQLIPFTATCYRFWLSDFIVKNHITFSEGKRPFEDVIQNWKGVVYAEKIAVFDEWLYYYRIREGSHSTAYDNNKILTVFTVNDEIKQFLHQTSCFEEFREQYFDSLFNHILDNHIRSPVYLQKLLFSLTLERFGNDEQIYAKRPLGLCLSPRIIYLRKVFSCKDKRYPSYFYYTLLLRLRLTPAFAKRFVRNVVYKLFA